MSFVGDGQALEKAAHSEQSELYMLNERILWSVDSVFKQKQSLGRRLPEHPSDLRPKGLSIYTLTPAPRAPPPTQWRVGVSGANVFLLPASVCQRGWAPPAAAGGEGGSGYSAHRGVT